MCLQQVTYAMSTTLFAVIVDNAGFQTKGNTCQMAVKKEKQPGKGPENP